MATSVGVVVVVAGPGILLADLVGGRFEISLDDRIDLVIAVGRFDIHFGFESFMSAVLAPGLSDGFKFNISWVALFFDEIILNGFHLGQVKFGAAVFGNREQFVIGQVADGDEFHCPAGFCFLGEGWCDVADCPVVDDGVGKELFGE